MKKKIFVVALAVCLLAVSIVGSSMAYFTDTEQYTNVFTAGNVDITLTAKGTDIDTTNNILDTKDQYVYPGQVISKDVVITNVGTEDAYVGAIITITNNNGYAIGNILDEADGANSIPVAIGNFLANLVDANDGYQVKVVETKNGNDVTAYTLYIIKTGALNGTRSANIATAPVQEATLFTDVVFPTTWDNAEMASVNGLQIQVKAFATQTAGFNSAETAIMAAFGQTNGEWANSGFTAPTNP